jgi:hypothetical protein
MTEPLRETNLYLRGKGKEAFEKTAETSFAIEGIHNALKRMQAMKKKIELPFELPKKLAMERLERAEQEYALKQTTEEFVGAINKKRAELNRESCEFWNKLRDLYDFGSPEPKMILKTENHTGRTFIEIQEAGNEDNIRR